MKVLVTISHYFKAQDRPKYSSQDARRQTARTDAIHETIFSYRSLFGPHAMLNLRNEAFDRYLGPDYDIAIAVMVNGDDHLLTDDFCRAHDVSLVRVHEDDPRMLGFNAHRYLADHLGEFDVFVFSEDDLCPRSPTFFDKRAWFQETFGWRRVLLPNRYESNPRGFAVKKYLDGPHAPKKAMLPHVKKLPDEALLVATPLSQPVPFERAENPHAGFFALSQEQMKYWVAQPHFLDRDCSFVSPLESAATLGILKTFPIYKSSGRGASFFEIEHLDDRYSRFMPKTRDVEPAREGRAGVLGSLKRWAGRRVARA